jgi:diguanylate cyclase (GGDEF)-like protein
VDNLRPAAKLYLTAIALTALGVALLSFDDITTLSMDRALFALALVGSMALAGLWSLPFAAKTKLYLDTGVLVAAVLLFEPGAAILVAAAGTLIAQVLRRQPWYQTLFNVAQTALMAATGGLIMAAGGWEVDPLRFGRPSSALLIMVAAVAMHLLNLAAVGVIVALQSGQTVLTVWRRTALHFDVAEALAYGTQVVLGVLAAIVADAHAWTVALLLLPAGGLYQALDHHIRQRRAVEARLVHQAFHDPLTDLPNRALFLDRLGQLQGRAGRRGEPLAVLFLDLDHFKFVNDRYGHAGGDRLLIAVAERLRECARPGDTVARLGGDEFTLLLDGFEDPAEVEAVAARVAGTLDAPFAIDDDEVAVTASIGIALSRRDHAAPADLLRDADVALYRAKERGKARYAIFDPAMGTNLRERIALEAELRQAVERDQLRLVYQPVVELATGRVVSVEALVRWEHPGRGLVLPAGFIPLAEEAGLVEPIGRWVLAEACRQAVIWQDQFTNAPAVAVNLSARQFQHPGLVEEVAGALRATGLAPDRLELEITESAVMADADVTAATLRDLKNLGVCVAIDDFGTGYSSLSYLRRFPLDLLKIDQSFVSGLGSDVGDIAIVEAVIGLAHMLGLRVVAEGVETLEQATRLRELGCEFGQGHLFGRPGSPEAITVLMEKVTYAVGAQATRAS